METSRTSHEFFPLTVERSSFMHRKPPFTPPENVLEIYAVRAGGLAIVLPRVLKHKGFLHGSV